MTTTPRIALVTGATQGLALVEGLGQGMTPADTVYLTGRNVDRVTQAVEAMPAGGPLLGAAERRPVRGRYVVTSDSRHLVTGSAASPPRHPIAAEN